MKIIYFLAACVSFNALNGMTIENSSSLVLSFFLKINAYNTTELPKKTLNPGAATTINVSEIADGTKRLVIKKKCIDTDANPDAIKKNCYLTVKNDTCTKLEWLFRDLDNKVVGGSVIEPHDTTWISLLTFSQEPRNDEGGVVISSSKSVNPENGL
jgi:hypothetical protein